MDDEDTSGQSCSASRGTPYRKGPCRECPWRRDVAPGQFPADRYEEMRNTSRQPEQIASAEDILGQPLFACHKSLDGAEAACAGWLATMGHQNLAVRFAVATGRLPADALEPKADWPPLFASYEEMESTQARRAQDGENGAEGEEGADAEEARTLDALLEQVWIGSSGSHEDVDASLQRIVRRLAHGRAEPLGETDGMERNSGGDGDAGRTSLG